MRLLNPNPDNRCKHPCVMIIEFIRVGLYRLPVPRRSLGKMSAYSTNSATAFFVFIQIKQNPEID